MKLERTLRLLWAKKKLEPFSLNLQPKQHNDNELNELSFWPSREVRTRPPSQPPAFSTTWQCRPTADPAPFCFNFEWSQCPPLSLVGKFNAKQAKDGNATWNARTRLVKFLTTNYICAQVGRYANRQARIYQKGIITAEFTSCKWPSQRNLHRLQTSTRTHEGRNTSNTLRKTLEIRSSMKQHLHLRRTPTLISTSVSSKQRYKQLHPPARERIQASRCPIPKKTPQWVWRRSLGWIGSNDSEFEISQDASLAICSGSGRAQHCLVFHLEGGQCNRDTRTCLLYKWNYHKVSTCHDLSTRFYYSHKGHAACILHTRFQPTS